MSHQMNVTQGKVELCDVDTVEMDTYDGTRVYEAPTGYVQVFLSSVYDSTLVFYDDERGTGSGVRKVRIQQLSGEWESHSPRSATVTTINRYEADAELSKPVLPWNGATKKAPSPVPNGILDATKTLLANE